jgi:hypothetical protein
MFNPLAFVFFRLAAYFAGLGIFVYMTGKAGYEFDNGGGVVILCVMIIYSGVFYLVDNYLENKGRK